MSKSISIGVTDTADGTWTITDPTPAELNFDADYRILSATPGETVLANVTSPIDQPEHLRFAQRSVSNIYAGSDIDPSVYLPSRRGISTVVEVRQVWKETSSTDETYERVFPVRVGISFTVPAYAAVDETLVAALIKRNLGALWEQGSATMDTGIASLLHGVMTKSAL